MSINNVKFILPKVAGLPEEAMRTTSLPGQEDKYSESTFSLSELIFGILSGPAGCSNVKPFEAGEPSSQPLGNSADGGMDGGQDAVVRRNDTMAQDAVGEDATSDVQDDIPDGVQVDSDATLADTTDATVADADGDGEADMSVEPEVVDVPDVTVDADGEIPDGAVADTDGDGEADMSVEPEVVDVPDVTVDADGEIPDGAVADTDGDGEADMSVEPEVVDVPDVVTTKTPPVLGEPTISSMMPSGDGCYDAKNVMTVNWYGQDNEKQQLACEVSVVNVGNKTEVAKVIVPPQNPSTKMKAEIPANKVEPFVDYNITVKCTDSDGLSATETTNAPVHFFHKNTMMWVRFKDGVGSVVTDSGPAKLNGNVIGKSNWVVTGGLAIDGSTRINFPKSPLFSSANELSVFLVFEPKNMEQTTFATILEVANSPKGQRLSVDVVEKSKARFAQKYTGVTHFVQDAMVAGVNELLFVQDANGAQIIKWVGGWKAVAQNSTYAGPVTIEDGGTMTMGCWEDGTHCFVGTLYEMQVVAKNIIAPCK